MSAAEKRFVETKRAFLYHCRDLGLDNPLVVLREPTQETNYRLLEHFTAHVFLIPGDDPLWEIRRTKSNSFPTALTCRSWGPCTAAQASALLGTH